MTRKEQVLHDYIVWKLKHNEKIEQKFLDAVGDKLPEILKQSEGK